MRAILLIVLVCMGAFGASHAATDAGGGEVRVPLEIYRQLVEQANHAGLDRQVDPAQGRNSAVALG